jgi:hypothetical protein
MPSLPSWKIRRRVLITSALFGAGLIVHAAWRWDDLMLASELVRTGTAILLAVIGFYTTAATFEDVKFRDHYQQGGGDDASH